MNDLNELNFATLLSRLQATRLEAESDPRGLETCDSCQRAFPLRFIRFTGERFLCPTYECREPDCCSGRYAAAAWR